MLNIAPPSTFTDVDTPALWASRSLMFVAPDSLISFVPMTSVAIGTSRNRYPLRVLVTTTSFICNRVSFIKTVRLVLLELNI